jgi:hypothetical protein
MMFHRSLLVLSGVVLFGSSLRAEKPTIVDVGPHRIVMRPGQYNTTHFPDQPISVLSERPLIVLMVCGNSTKLFYGRDWNSITYAPSVLRPSSGGAFDNGYAGIGGIHRDGKTIYGLYHAEDHVGKSSAVSKARNQSAGMFSVGLAVSQDGGKSFRKVGQALSSAHPYEQGKECGGLGDITVCADRTNSYLLAYYADFSRGQGKGIQICVARCAIKDRAIPGAWKKILQRLVQRSGTRRQRVLCVVNEQRRCECVVPTYQLLEETGSLFSHVCCNLSQ